MDLLVVCGLGVLINVLSLETYTAPGLNGKRATDEVPAMDEIQAQQWAEYDINALSEDDRKMLCLARGQSFELIEWLDWNFTTGLPNIPIQSLFSNILLNMCKMLCDYKWRADKEEIKCIADFTLARLQIQITGVLVSAASRNPHQVAFNGIGIIASKWKLPMPDTVAQSILPRGLDGVHFKKINRGMPYERLTLPELFRKGETEFDKDFASRLDVKREIIGAS